MTRTLRGGSSRRHAESVRECVLCPAVLAFKRCEPLDARQWEIVRDYLRFRIWLRDWDSWSETVERLRVEVDELSSNAAIVDWYYEALHDGVSPL